MIRTTRLLALASAILLGTGCGDSDAGQSACLSNADCPQGQYCGAGAVCTFDCTPDAGCASGSCSPSGQCVDGGTLDSAVHDGSAHDAVDGSAHDAVDGSLPDVHDSSLHDSGGDSIDDVHGEEVLVPDCTTATECDDSNACSTDTCVGGACQHSAAAGTHLKCQSSQCAAVDNTTTDCTDLGDCAAAGNACGSTAGECPKSTCPFDAHDRYLDGIFPSFGLPYNDVWDYEFGNNQTIHNPDAPNFTSQSCHQDSSGGSTRGSIHVRALHKGAINVAVTDMSSAKVAFIKSTLKDARGWVRAGLSFTFTTSFTSATDIQFTYCANCPVSTSGPRGSTTNPCGGSEFHHRDSDYNVIQFTGGSCFDAQSSCSRWLINHEVGHALGLADREHASLEGKSIMNHTHYYGVVWPSDDLITMVRALETCGGRACLTP